MNRYCTSDIRSMREVDYSSSDLSQADPILKSVSITSHFSIHQSLTQANHSPSTKLIAHLQPQPAYKHPSDLPTQPTVLRTYPSAKPRTLFRAPTATLALIEFRFVNGAIVLPCWAPRCAGILSRVGFTCESSTFAYICLIPRAPRICLALNATVYDENTCGRQQHEIAHRGARTVLCTCASYCCFYSEGRRNQSSRAFARRSRQTISYRTSTFQHGKFHINLLC
jgi:hypothetical protein